MTTLLAIIRHGKTTWNLEGKLQGRANIPLSSAGINELSKLSIPLFLKTATWITSPLKRAMETAESLNLKDVSIESRLVEMDWGEWEGKTLKKLRETLGTKIKEEEDRGLDLSPPGGESPRQVQERIKPLLKEISQIKSSDIVGAVSHKGVMRSLLSLATGWDMLGAPPVKLDWAAIQIFSVDNQGTPQPYQYNVPLEKGDYG